MIPLGKCGGFPIVLVMQYPCNRFSMSMFLQRTDPIACILEYLVRRQRMGLVSWVISLSLAHRIFSNKVLMELEKICRVPFLQLISHPTWHSPWTLFMKVPPSSLHACCQAHTSNNHSVKSVIKSQFRT